MRDPWPHQVEGVSKVLEAIEAGEKRILLTSPTGGGKTDMMIRLVKHFIDQHEKVILYTDRRMLLEQSSGVFDDAGLVHGVRAAGADDDLYLPFQIASIQTEHSRVTKRKSWKLHEAKLVLLDEAHKQKGKMVEAILTEHYNAGAAIVGVTATPIDLGPMYDKLVVAGRVSDCRRCGSLVPVRHFGPDEPDLKAFKVSLEGDVTESQARKAIMTPTIFGRVMKWFDVLNPTRRPTILFAPGVAESLWFAQQFTEAGITAAHIDGSDVWSGGELKTSCPERRAELLAASKSGELTVICNRFVMREGIDAPWLSHGIFATIFGSLQSYLQSGGRLLRAYPGIDSKTIQDHGGNWWRWGSLNSDREWSLSDTSNMLAGIRVDRFRDKSAKEPFLCPNCKMVWSEVGGGMVCQRELGGCGHRIEHQKKVRAVVQVDGSMKEMHGDIYKSRTVAKFPGAVDVWIKMYHRSLRGKGVKTFRAAEALYAYENKWQWPSRTWPYMPREYPDFFRLVPDVPRDRLY